MISLYSSSVLLIEQQRKLDSRYARYRFLDEAGQQVGAVKEFRYYGSETDAERPQRFGINGPDGKRLLMLDKPKQMFQRRFDVYQKRAHVGTITRKIKLVGSKIELSDPKGNTLAEIIGDWDGWEFQILREETELAKIDKTDKMFPGLAELLTTKDTYALQFHHEHSKRLRKLVVAATIVIDQRLHEERSDSEDSSRRRVFGGSGFEDPDRPRKHPLASTGSKGKKAAKKKVKALAKKKLGGSLRKRGR